MQISNIHDTWGTIVEVHGVDEVLKQPQDFWRSLGYDRDLIVFRGLGEISHSQYHELLTMFGTPWNAHEYRQTTEFPITFEQNGQELALSVFSNLTASRIGTSAMPWHADIPNNGDQSFPWRSLYIVQNPNPESGITEFMNVRLDRVNPSSEDLAFFNSIELGVQSWYVGGERDERQPFIKTHPVTGVESLRLNYYVNGPGTKTAWIKETFLNGENANNHELLSNIYDNLQKRSDLLYHHKWQTYDLVIYDNWSFVHRRTKVDIQPGQVREFIRANIHHNEPRQINQ